MMLSSTGVMGGSHFTHPGSGGNHLCLPHNPQWNDTCAGFQSNSYIYGTEFRVNPSNNLFGSTVGNPHNRDVQCAVCYSPNRPSHVMIPARLQCPYGWTVEYMGFLMAAHHEHQKSEYVCVDQEPDSTFGPAANMHGNRLYQVEAVCGSLPCPKYRHGYELTCVVCTK